MIKTKLIIVFLLVLTPLLLSPANAAELSTLQATYISEMGKIRKAATENHEKLQAEYIQDLEALLKKAQAAGNLDAVLTINQEITRFRRDQDVPTSALSTKLPDLLNLQTACRTAAEKILGDRAKRMVTLVSHYDRSLDNLQKGYTRANKLTEAVDVRKERETVQRSADVIAAKELLAKIEAAKPRTSPIASDIAARVDSKAASATTEAASRLSSRPLSTVEKSKLQSHIRRRYEDLCDEILDQDFEKAREFLDPAYIEENGTQAANNVLKMAFGFVKMTNKQNVKLAVDKVELEEDAENARVFPKIWANNLWHNTAACSWIKVEDEWYLKMGYNEASQQKQEQQDFRKQQNKKKRRPHKRP